MPRSVAVRGALLVVLIAFLSATIAGQASQKKTTQKKAPAKAAPAKTEAKPAPAPARDIKIRTRYTSGAQVSENTTYVKDGRQRVEFPGLVSIDQCDLGRTLVVDPASKTYLVKPYPKDSPPASPAPSAADPQAAMMMGQKAPAKPPKGGVITYTTTVTDTGERKQMFGRDARHVTTTVTREASPTACDKSAETVEVDGWYVDLPGVAHCPIPAPAKTAKPEECVDRVEARTNGDAKLGFPVATKTTTRTGEGDKQEIVSSSMEVTALEATRLDAALFDVPAGYREVHSEADLMAGLSTRGGLTDAMLGSTADGTSTAAPKNSGRVRIGVLEPVDKSARNLPTRELREELAGNFRKGPFEALTLSGSSPEQAQEDAKRMQCDYVLYSEITGIKTSKPGKVGGMLKKVSRDGPPRDVHEVTIDYKLYPVAAPASAAFGDTTKATSGGFNVRSALHLAMFAGSLYLRFSGLGLMMNPAMMSALGGRFSFLGEGGLFDPRMSAMSSITQMAMSGGMPGLDGGDGTEGTTGAVDDTVEIRQTVSTALTNTARGTMDQLQKSRK